MSEPGILTEGQSCLADTRLHLELLLAPVVLEEAHPAVIIDKELAMDLRGHTSSFDRRREGLTVFSEINMALGCARSLRDYSVGGYGMIETFKDEIEIPEFTLLEQEKLQRYEILIFRLQNFVASGYGMDQGDLGEIYRLSMLDPGSFRSQVVLRSFGVSG